jgi:hypothetical protein
MFVNNSVAFDDTGLHIDGRTDLGGELFATIANNVVAFNGSGVRVEGDVAAGVVNESNLVFGNGFDDFVPGPGTLKVDPLFVPASGSIDDFSLLPGRGVIRFTAASREARDNLGDRSPARRPAMTPTTAPLLLDDAVPRDEFASEGVMAAHDAAPSGPWLRSDAVLPWWSRLFGVMPRAPMAVGVALGAILVFAFITLDWIDGNLQTLSSGAFAWWQHVEVRSALIISALLAGVLVTHRYEELGTRRDLQRLAPELEPGVADAELVTEFAVDTRLLAVAGGLGALLIMALVPMLYVDPSRFLHTATYRLPSVLFDLAVGAALGSATARTLVAAIAEDRSFARLADRVREIDPLQLAPLRPFARRGLRRALRWLLLATIASLAFIDAGYAEPPALILVGILGFAMFSFVLPVWRIHVRIRHEKHRLLEELQRLVRDEQKRVREAGAGSGRLADLLAWQARLAAAREWPVDGSTLLRFALLLSLPIGSWLGGSMMDHAVDWLLR